MLAQARPSQAMLKQSSQAKTSLIYKYTKKGVLLEDKVGPCSTSSTFFKFIRHTAKNATVWWCILFEVVPSGADDKYFYIKARPNRSQPDQAIVW